MHPTTQLGALSKRELIIISYPHDQGDKSTNWLKEDDLGTNRALVLLLASVLDIGEDIVLEAFVDEVP